MTVQECFYLAAILFLALVGTDLLRVGAQQRATMRAYEERLRRDEEGQEDEEGEEWKRGFKSED